MIKRKLVVGDIHGGLKALKQVMERAGVTTSDKMIFLGDYVDGWSQSPGVVEYLMELNETHDCVFIKGNHDDLCYEWLKDGSSNKEWLFHGGSATVAAYEKQPEEIRTKHLEFFERLRNYYLDEENNLYVHAGFTSIHGVTREYFPEMFYWDRSLWETALSLDPELDKEDLRYPKRLLHYKEIFIGHTPTIRLNETTPIHAANIWNIDTGAAYKSPLTLMNVATKEFWQSDPVNELYPDENGRN
ncbi:serine/threonine protein phosphatase [Leptobacterium flavescens]|uniref:Serine/threonine protein phosphatase n=1 Tax=Leptobacterium flavescens TaxID=472055 RepID=A0A6P0UQV4_9FLAO|nr:metallophosphoesterase family protein [Leptobacterium flavescens]NER14378.1 serine/threonine protein phosphatase [Leptobacterium flavescens]